MIPIYKMKISERKENRFPIIRNYNKVRGNKKNCEKSGYLWQGDVTVIANLPETITTYSSS